MAMYWQAGTTDIPTLLHHAFPRNLQTRSLQSLSRAITPMLAGAISGIFGYRILFTAGAALAVAAFGIGRTLPKPTK